MNRCSPGVVVEVGSGTEGQGHTEDFDRVASILESGEEGTVVGQGRGERRKNNVLKREEKQHGNRA